MDMAQLLLVFITGTATAGVIGNRADALLTAVSRRFGGSRVKEVRAETHRLLDEKKLDIEETQKFRQRIDELFDNID